MRFPKERVRHLAETLLTRLQQGGHVELTGDRKRIVEALDVTITEELSVEDRLNAEVRQLLRVHETEIEKGQVDYQKMFTMIKAKLVRERKLVL
jgi:hypothetical protein